jgi:hypothetical protein
MDNVQKHNTCINVPYDKLFDLWDSYDNYYYYYLFHP